MKNNSPFDDHIKKQFGNYKPEVPPHIWENIMAQKDQKKPAGLLFNLRGKRFTMLLLLFIATGAGALIVHQVYKNNPDKGQPGKDYLLTSKANIQNTSNIPQDVPEEMKLAQKDPLINNSSTSSLPKPGIISYNTDVAVKKLNTDGQLFSSTRSRKKIDASIDKDKVNKNADGKPDDNISFKKSNPAAKNNHGSNEQLPVHIYTDESLNNTNPKKNKAKKIAGRSAVSVQAPIPETTPSTQEVNTAEERDFTSNNEVAIENLYLDLTKERTNKIFSLEVRGSGLAALDIPCPRGKNSTGNRYLEIYGGPDYAFRSFNDTANSVYLQKRKESTSFKSAFSIGLRYTKVFNNGISFRTGINYSQVNEKFKFEQGHIVQHVYTLDQNGDTTGSYATTGTRYKTTHNKYRTIDIPLMLGYETGNEKFRVNFNAGLVVNAYSWQKGDVLDSAYQPVNITTGKSNSAYQFKTNVGLGVTGGVSLYYKLTRKTYFLAEPYFRYNFSAANKADITLKQKYTTLGLRLGLRIDF